MRGAARLRAACRRRRAAVFSGRGGAAVWPGGVGAGASIWSNVTQRWRGRALGGEVCSACVAWLLVCVSSVVVSLREYAYGVSCETTPRPLACKYG